MTISCAQGGLTLVQLADDAGKRLTNLQIQKILYFANMLYIGANGNKEPLFRNKFLAWKYGPVIRELYERLSRYEGAPIPVNAFDDIIPIMNEKGQVSEEKYEEEFKVIKDAYDRWGSFPAWRLVEISHWKEGAWSKSIQHRKEEIDDVLIWNEFNARYKK